MTPPIHNENNYRTYTQQHLNELTLLHQTQQINFNLKKNNELMNLFNDPQRHNADIKQRTLKKITKIERHIEKLQSIHDQLLTLTNTYPNDNNTDYPIIENLSNYYHHRTK